MVGASRMKSSGSTVFHDLQTLNVEHFLLDQELRAVMRPNCDFKLTAYYLDQYFPINRRPDDDKSSYFLLRLKDGFADGIEHFASLLAPRFPASGLRPSFVAIPGHREGFAERTGGLRRLINRVIDAQDMSECLVRTQGVERSSTSSRGMRPTAKMHFDTMKVYDSRRLTGKHLILIDDVLTKGATMKGALARLSQVDGIMSVTCLALTRTGR